MVNKPSDHNPTECAFYCAQTKTVILIKYYINKASGERGNGVEGLDNHLTSMDDSHFIRFLNQAILTYLKDLVRSGRCSEDNAP